MAILGEGLYKGSYGDLIADAERQGYLGKTGQELLENREDGLRKIKFAIESGVLDDNPSGKELMQRIFEAMCEE